MQYHINLTLWFTHSFEKTTYESWSDKGWNIKARFRHLACVGIMIPAAIDTIMALGATCIFVVSLGYGDGALNWAFKRSMSLISIPAKIHTHFFKIFARAKTPETEEFTVKNKKYTDFANWGLESLGFQPYKFYNECDKDDFKKVLKNVSDQCDDQIEKFNKENTDFFETYIKRRAAMLLGGTVLLVISCALTCFSCISTVFSLLPIQFCKNLTRNLYCINASFSILTLFCLTCAWAPGQGRARFYKLIQYFVDEISLQT